MCGRRIAARRQSSSSLSSSTAADANDALVERLVVVVARRGCRSEAHERISPQNRASPTSSSHCSRARACKNGRLVFLRRAVDRAPSAARSLALDLGARNSRSLCASSGAAAGGYLASSGESIGRQLAGVSHQLADARAQVNVGRAQGHDTSRLRLEGRRLPALSSPLSLSLLSIVVVVAVVCDAQSVRLSASQLGVATRSRSRLLTSHRDARAHMLERSE